MTTYTITATRDGRWWMIDIPEIDGLTQARRLADIEETARSFITVSEDVEPTAVDIHVSHIYVDDDDLLTTKTALAEARATASKAEQDAQNATASAAAALANKGVTLRDVADILGVSFQRVSQLLARAS